MIRAVGMGALAGASLLGGAALAFGVRGRSSQMFGASACRGSKNRKTLALTFDDGPSESTPEVLNLLARHGISATFFQCGANIRRLPAAAREVRDAGHEIGNHSDTHARLYLRSARFIYREFHAAQRTIEDTLDLSATLMRAPFGARWFGFRAAQEALGLLGVMWTIIGRDWTLDGAGVAQRVLESAVNGAIICLHDGRELQPNPNVCSTLDALAKIVPGLIAKGYQFQTVSRLLCPTN